MGIGERLKTVREETALSKINFAQAIGITTANTIYRWEKELAFPPADILATISQKYGINIHWLTTGHGPMKAEQSLSDARLDLAADYADDDPRKKAAAAQHSPGRKAASHIDQDHGEVMLDNLDLDLNPEPPAKSQGFKISEMLAMTARVLESGTTYAVALAHNIQHFDRAITAESSIDRLQRTVDHQGETIRAQSQTIQALQSTMAQESSAMRKEVEELKSQLARLLATGEDNPDHGQEVA